MPVGLLGAVGAIGGAAIQANAAKKAANAQTAAADAQIALQREIYNDTSAKFQPFLDAGTKGWNAYLSEFGLADAPDGFTGFQASPSYQYELGQGLDAIQSTAAARGNLLSGATLQSAQGFGQNLANQDYGNFLNRLAGIGQMGQASAGQQANVAANYGANAGNALAARGNAASAGAIGAANAWSGGLNNLAGVAGYMGQNGGWGGINIGKSGSLFGGNSWG